MMGRRNGGAAAPAAACSGGRRHLRRRAGDQAAGPTQQAGAEAEQDQRLSDVEQNQATTQDAAAGSGLRAARRR